MRIAPFLAWTALLTVACSLAGCTTFFAERMIDTPHAGRVFAAANAPTARDLSWLGVDEVLYVPVGPPEATIAAWVFEPEAVDEPVGTILVIHGYQSGPIWMVSKAHALNKLGYRAVVVALRGYGSSSGDYHTFGVHERDDMARVIDALEARQLSSSYLGVLGNSYGAAVAIQLAGADPRIDVVVAQSAFSSLREVVPPFSRTMVPVLSWMLSETQFDAIVDTAGQIAAFDPDEADTVAAIRRTAAPVLLIHGDWDRIVPPEQAQALLAAGGQHVELIRVPAAGHVAVFLDVDGKVGREGVAWIERWRPREM